MRQQGQLLKLKTNGADGRTLWAYRCRVGGRGSERVQRGGFRTREDAEEALEHAVEAVRREQGSPRRTLTATIAKLQWLFAKAVAAFG